MTGWSMKTLSRHFLLNHVRPGQRGLEKNLTRRTLIRCLRVVVTVKGPIKRTNSYLENVTLPLLLLNNVFEHSPSQLFQEKCNRYRLLKEAKIRVFISKLP